MSEPTSSNLWYRREEDIKLRKQLLKRLDEIVAKQ